jgi:subtilisin family serine protease
LLFVNLSLFIGVQMSNIKIGSLQDNYFHIGSTGKTEPTDTYFFSLPTMGSARISAEGFSGDINMELGDKEGRLIKSISTSGKSTGILSTDNLGVADDILNVSPVSGNTNYQVSLTPDGKVDPLTGMGVEAGFFTTDQKGEVGSDATTFTSDNLDNPWASFNYTLTGLVAGKDQLKAIAYDRAGAASNEGLRNLSIDSAPGNLQFRILPLYTKGEKISFSDAKVFDSEGVSDIDKVDFWFQKEGDDQIEIDPDVTEFTSDSDGLGRFNFSENLSSLAPDRYQLSAKAYDQAGNAISEASEKFALISDPGSDGLSDEVRLAIVGAGNLDSYSPEALAETKEWVVWVTPGQSSQELAIIGAIYQGYIDRILKTFICKCPKQKPIARENEADQLKALSGVEYAYPQVPVQLNLVYEPNDTLDNKQWNFKNANVPAALDVINPATSQTVRGRGATIALVDDGLEYEHPDFANGYSHSLSIDFTVNILVLEDGFLYVVVKGFVSCGTIICVRGI